jgi:hypothetical protein
MKRLAVGVLGFLVGGLCAVILLWIATEALFLDRIAVEPPTGEEFQYLAQSIDRDYTRLIGTPLALLFGGSAGCWATTSMMMRRPN